MKEPVDHIERPRLPWREKEEASLTECGYAAVKVKTLTRSEFQRRLGEYGQQRTALLTCWTCMETARRWGAWDDDPRQAVEREIQWEGRWNEDRGHRLRDELRAIAILINRHNPEFTKVVREIEGIVDLRERKRQSRQ